MAHFVSCDSGWVNLDHVALVRERRRSDGLCDLVFEGLDGKVIARDSISSFDPEEVSAQVVAAAPGAFAIVLTPFPQSDTWNDRPDDVHIERVPIVAWRIIAGVGIPMLIEKPLDAATVFIPMPDGKLTAPENATFDNQDAARVAVLEWAQDAWDRVKSKSKEAHAPEVGK